MIIADTGNDKENVGLNDDRRREEDGRGLH